MTPSRALKTEVIAFSSGKGGTGKTLIAACLGYALRYSGHSVLMIDGDPGTDGLSLFLLGPEGYDHIDEFLPENTLTGMLRQHQATQEVRYEARAIHRPRDHKITYQALISGRNVYGNLENTGDTPAVPDLDQGTFRRAMAAFFESIRAGGAYDYVLVDTRGGFAFESTDICALADGFIVVTEPDYTSFYQDRNLVRRISAAAQQLGRRPLLRSIIVNKASETEQPGESLDLDKLERSFRLELEKEFPLKFKETYPVPIDIEAVQAYKTQQMPYVAAPASHFSFATLTAFSDILRIVTSRWSEERVNKWNELVESVSRAVGERNRTAQRAREEAARRTAELEKLRAQNEQLTRELDQTKAGYDRELERTRVILRALPQASAPLPVTRRTTLRWAVLAAVVAAVGLAGLSYSLFSSRESPNDLLKQAYNPSLPPSLRVDYLKRLYAQGQRNFESIDLSGLNLDGTEWKGASFRMARLARSSFRNADLRGADLTGADLSGANLAGARIEPAQWLAASVDARTVLPDGPRPNPDEKFQQAVQVVPDLRGRSTGEARSILARAGLTLGAVRSVPGRSVPPETVLGQEPPPGTGVRPGTAVSIAVAQRLEPALSTVPKLTGMPVRRAADALKNAGLQLGDQRAVYSRGVKEGVIVDQSPAAGARVRAGTSVTVSVAARPPTGGTPAPGQ